MFALVITIHVIACVLLILIVLIQQGKGGGLIDTFSSAESIFGTRTNTFLVKSTSVLSVIFFFTCLSLAFLSMQKSKSLIETSYKPPTKVEHKTQQSAPLTATSPGTSTAPVAPAIETQATTQQTPSQNIVPSQAGQVEKK